MSGDYSAPEPLRRAFEGTLYRRACGASYRAEMVGCGTLGLEYGHAGPDILSLAASTFDSPGLLTTFRRAGLEIGVEIPNDSELAAWRALKTAQAEFERLLDLEAEYRDLLRYGLDEARARCPESEAFLRYLESAPFDYNDWLDSLEGRLAELTGQVSDTCARHLGVIVAFIRCRAFVGVGEADLEMARRGFDLPRWSKTSAVAREA